MVAINSDDSRAHFPIELVLPYPLSANHHRRHCGERPINNPCASLAGVL